MPWIRNCVWITSYFFLDARVYVKLAKISFLKYLTFIVALASLIFFFTAGADPGFLYNGRGGVGWGGGSRKKLLHTLENICMITHNISCYYVVVFIPVYLRGIPQI